MRRFATVLLVLIFIMSILFIGSLLAGLKQERIEVIDYERTKASVISLRLPDRWQTGEKGLTDGFLLVRTNEDALFFRRGNSENIYEWKKDLQTLAEASLDKWDNATDERYILSGNPEISSHSAEEIPLVINNLKKPTGNEILDAESSRDFIKILSFTGTKTEEDMGNVFGKNYRYRGELYLQFYERFGINPIVTIRKDMENSNNILQTSFWYDSSTYIIDNDRKIIIIELK